MVVVASATRAPTLFPVSVRAQISGKGEATRADPSSVDVLRARSSPPPRPPHRASNSPPGPDKGRTAPTSARCESTTFASRPKWGRRSGAERFLVGTYSFLCAPLPSTALLKMATGGAGSRTNKSMTGTRAKVKSGKGRPGSSWARACREGGRATGGGRDGASGCGWARRPPKVLYTGT